MALEALVPEVAPRINRLVILILLSIKSYIIVVIPLFVVFLELT